MSLRSLFFFHMWNQHRVSAFLSKRVETSGSIRDSSVICFRHRDSFWTGHQRLLARDLVSSESGRVDFCTYLDIQWYQAASVLGIVVRVVTRRGDYQPNAFGPS